MLKCRLTLYLEDTILYFMGKCSCSESARRLCTVVSVTFCRWKKSLLFFCSSIKTLSFGKVCKVSVSYWFWQYHLWFYSVSNRKSVVLHIATVQICFSENLLKLDRRRRSFASNFRCKINLKSIRKRRKMAAGIKNNMVAVCCCLQFRILLSGEIIRYSSSRLVRHSRLHRQS